MDDVDTSKAEEKDTWGPFRSPSSALSCIRILHRHRPSLFSTAWATWMPSRPRWIRRSVMTWCQVNDNLIYSDNVAYNCVWYRILETCILICICRLEIFLRRIRVAICLIHTSGDCRPSVKSCTECGVWGLALPKTESRNPGKCEPMPLTNCIRPRMQTIQKSKNIYLGQQTYSHTCARCWTHLRARGS